MSLTLSRRRLLTGLIAAPIVVSTPGLLMPVKALVRPPHLFEALSTNPAWAFVQLYDAMGLAVTGRIDWAAINAAAAHCDERVPA